MGDAADAKRFERAVEALRLPADPMERVVALRAARERFEALEAETVREARRAGTTWKTVGALYGLSKQGAQQRFRDADGVPGAPAPSDGS